jgi:hypothetical protein
VAENAQHLAALSSHLGRLGFMGQLDPIEVACGEKIGRICGQFDKTMATTVRWFAVLWDR